MSFDDWYADLISNYVWHEPASMRHKPETFREVCRQVHEQYLAKDIFPPIQEARSFVSNKLNKITPDKVRVDWTKKALEQKKKEEPVINISEEEIKLRLQEWQDSLKNVKMVSAVPKLTARQIIEEGDWRAVSKIERSPIEKVMVLQEHQEKINNARRKLFTEHFPDANEEEIIAYLNKFPI